MKKINVIKKVALMICVGLVMTQVASAAVDDRVKELERKVNVLTREISELKLGETPTDEKVIKTGLGPAASKIYAKSSGVSIGGYGEMIYNNYSTLKDDGTAGAKDKIDLYRNILYVGYKFNENLLFNTEIEFEHANTGVAGSGAAVEVEFAYIDLLLNPAFNFRSGMMLIPVGMINEIHEPPTFWSANRPYVENSIIPATWSANGVGFFGELLDGLDYKIYLTESLIASSNSGFGFTGSTGIRGGRQKGAAALAENFAVSARLDYEILPGSVIGASLFTGPTSQGNISGTNANVSVYDLHSRLQFGGLEIRGLYTEVTINDADKINVARNLTGSNGVGSKLIGSYIEAGYDIIPLFIKNTDQALIPFVRFESLNTQAEVPVGYSASAANNKNYTIYGVSYLPISNIAFKLSFDNETNGAGTGQDSINFASTYLF